jgi:hypothetical protein
MTDSSRAEITNGIWLCRNCHKLIDTDDQQYSVELIFAWREKHEEYVQSELGSTSDRIRFEKQSSRYVQFDEYPPLIRRILIDKPDGWEWRLTAEIMRYLYKPIFRKLDDLRDGLYIGTQEHIGNDEILDWLSNRMSETTNLLTPVVSLLDRLTESWGELGEPGDPEEINHICCLIKKSLDGILLYEEKIYFACVPDEFEGLIELIKDLLGSQIKKLAEIPDLLDEVVSLIGSENGGSTESPRIIQKTIEFEVPDGWGRKFNRELKRVEKYQDKGDGGIGCWSTSFIIIIVIWIISLI